MAHHLAHIVQTFLHSHNKPRLSFYDEMMTNKKKEEERAKAKQLQKLQEQQEADKLISDEEVINCTFIIITFNIKKISCNA
jgi:hypothetical protein